MRTTIILIALAMAAQARAQSPVYGNADLGKPVGAEVRLSPDEAVRVLRGSHSIADLTDYRSPGRGPTIVVMGESTTPWEWPAGTFAPTLPLGNLYDSNLYAPTGYGYAPYYANSYSGRQRYSNHSRTQSTPSSHAVALPPMPPANAPRNIVMSSQAAGRRR